MSKSGNGDDTKDARRKFVEDFLVKWEKGSISPGTSKFSKILKEQEESIKKNPTNPKLWFARGTLLSKIENHEDAIKCFDVAIKLKPDYKEAWNAKADALSSLDRHEDAALCYKKALESVSSYANLDTIDIEDEETAVKGIIQEVESEKKREALLKKLEGLDTTLKIYPNNVDVWYSKALVLIKLNEYFKAMECLHQVTKLDLKHTKVWNTKGDLFRKLGDHKKASLCYKRAQEFLDDTIPCPLCGEFVSPKVERCPECGIGFDEVESKPVAPESDIRDKPKPLKVVKEPTVEIPKAKPKPSIRPSKPEPPAPKPAPKPLPLSERANILINGDASSGPKPDKPGLTNGVEVGTSLPKGTGKINGYQSEKTRLMDAREFSRDGAINGLTNGFRLARDGLTNGLTNGMGLTNGLAYPSFFRENVRRKWKMYVVPLVAVMLLMTPMVFQTSEMTAYDIMIDGDFSDWNGKTYSVGDDLLLKPGIDMVNVGVENNKDYLSFYVESRNTMMAGNPGDEDLDTIFIFIDYDQNEGTGYRVNSVGADSLVMISGDSSGIRESVLREYDGSRGNDDWNGWRTISSLEFANQGSRLETQAKWEALGDEERPIDVFFYSLGHDLEQDSSDYIISNEKGILNVEISSAATETLSGNGIPLLNVRLDALSSDIDVEEMSFKLIGTAGAHELSSILLVDLNGNSILDQKIPISNDVAFRFSESLHLTEGTSRNLQLRVDIKDATGSTIGATIASAKAIFTSQGTVNLVVKPSTYELGYIGTIPTNPVVDGGFSEWKQSSIDYDTENKNRSDIDIQAYNVSTDSNNAYFYLKVDGSLMNGTLVPFHNRIPAPIPPSPTITDSDRDSIPDSVDPFQDDFNNNGNPDTNTVNDVDEDGILEHPMGNDWWLNTTIPNSTGIPLEYRGIIVSIYIGPVEIPPSIGEDVIRIYLETTGDPSDGYLVSNPLSGNMYADYMIELKGKNGNILSNNLLKFNGQNPGNWKWDFLMNIDELEKDNSQVEGSIDLSLSGISSLSYAFIEMTDWHLNTDETEGRESVKSVANEATKATALTELVSGVGTDEGDGFGWNVSYAGDVNNDGYPDIIVGAPYNDTTNGAPADWWDTDWKYRRNLTFVNEDQSETFDDFTVMVKLNSQNFDYSKAKADGTDLRFIDEDGTTSLKYHIEKWNSSGSSWVWVNVTGIDSSTSADYMHMYYGNLGASDVQDVEGTYDSNFSAVWHLNETSSTHFDSTSNNNDGSPQGGVTQDAAGWIAGGDSFDGSDDYVDCGTSDSLNISYQITLEAWVKPEGYEHPQTDPSVVGKYEDSERSYVLKFGDDPGDVDDWDFRMSSTGDANEADVHASNSVVSNAWQYMAGTWDGSTARLYLNGAQIDDDVSFSGPLYQTATEVRIGSTSYYDEWDGLIDEVRISNIGRSGDWVRAQYLSMTDNFIVYGAEEDILNTGAAYIFFGYPGIGSDDINASNANVTIYGEDAGDLFGWSVSDLGNVDSDTKDDVIIGTPGAGAGKAYVFYGRNTWSSTYDASSADVEITGEDTGHRFGASVSRAGDVDNGDYNDIIAGAYTYAGTSWWDSDWTYRKKLTFANGAQTESLDNFAVLVNLSASNFDYLKANSDGSDLRFVDADDSTELNYHVEEWSTSGTSNLWVNVTEIDGSSNTDYIWMYYGNSEAQDAQDFHETYDGNYSGVWHMNETSGWVYDSTSKGNVGVPTQNLTQDTPGVIDGADYFDGTYDEIVISNHSSVNPPNDMTLEAWVKVEVLSSTLGHTQTFVAKRHSGDPYQSFELFLNSGDNFRFGWANSTGPSEYSGWNGPPALDCWYYLVGVKDGSTLRFYLNGSTAGTFTDTADGTMLQSDLGLKIGNDEGEVVNGTIDEVRLHDTARSADWIAAQYLSMTDTFITYGSEEVGKKGRAYVFFGDGSIPTAAGSADKIFTGESAGDRFGFSVSNAGDIDNDGKDDVIIGAPFNDDSGTDAGEAYIYVSGDMYAYVESNTTTQGYMTDFNNSKSASDSGAYAILKEEYDSVTTLWLWISDATSDYIYKVDANASLSSGSESGNVNLSWENAGTTYPHGMALYDGYVWVVDYGTDNIEKYYKNNGTLINTYDISGFSGDARGFTYGGGYFWIGDSGDDNIYKVDPSDFSMVDYIDCDEGYFSSDLPTYLEGLAWRDDIGSGRLIMTDPTEDKIYTIDLGNLSGNAIPAGNVTEVNTQASDPGGLGWDGQYYWITDDADDTIYKVDPATGNNVDSFSWTPGAPTGIEAEYETISNYKMDIEFNAANVPSGSNYYLELNYSVDGTETDFGVLVYDGSTWDDMTAQGDLDQTSFTTKSYTLDSGHRLSSGNVRVRYIGRNETGDTSNSTLNVEYHRIRVTDSYITFSGESAGHRFGWSVANASDINEDGSYDDVVIGAPNYRSEPYSAVWSSSDVLAHQNEDSADQGNADITADSNDNVFVVWSDERNGANSDDIFAQKFDSDGNPQWGSSDIKVNTDSLLEQAGPSVAVDPNGNIIVVWSDERHGSTNDTIYAQKLDTNGNRLWDTSDVRVNQNTSSCTRVAPDIAIDSDGNAIIVWRDNRNGDYDIYAQKLDSNGVVQWGASDVKVNQYASSENELSPRIALDPYGYAIIVWSDGRNGATTNDSIYAQMLDTEGNELWGSSDVRINQDAGTYYRSAPRIATDSDGNSIVVWIDERNGGSDARIYAQGLSRYGVTQWSDDVQVNQDTTDQTGGSDIAVDSNGHFFVAWQDQSGSSDIYSQKLDLDGNVHWGSSDIRLNQGVGDFHTGPSLTVDSSDDLIVSFTNTTGDWNVLMQKFSATDITGRAYIFNGGSPMDSTSDVNLTGENDGDKFGFSVHGVGDVDLDGVPDVAVGAPYYDNGATSDAGIIYVYNGSSSMDNTYDYFFKGTQANQHFGWSVGFGLNINGGSYNAIIAGSPDYDNGSDTDAGQAKALIIIPEYSTVIVPLLIILVLFALRSRRKNGKRA
jgi:tetratricopeptide (TPR) repeat protein